MTNALNKKLTCSACPYLEVSNNTQSLPKCTYGKTLFIVPSVSTRCYYGLDCDDVHIHTVKEAEPVERSNNICGECYYCVCVTPNDPSESYFECSAVKNPIPVLRDGAACSKFKSKCKSWAEEARRLGNIPENIECLEIHTDDKKEKQSFVVCNNCNLYMIDAQGYTRKDENTLVKEHLPVNYCPKCGSKLNSGGIKNE